MTDGETARASRDNRKAIPVSFARDRGPRSFTTLMVQTQRDEIVLDPRVPGGCMIILDEDAATALFDVLGTWLG